MSAKTRFSNSEAAAIRSRADTHSVQFYSDDEFLLARLSRLAGSALGAGDAAIVIATPSHRELLQSCLSRRGLDVERAIGQGRFLLLDAAEALSQFMVNGWPDEKRFTELIGNLVSRASAAVRDEDGRVALFGEMVALLWAEGKSEAALRLEQLGNEIARAHALSIVCAYPLSLFYRSGDAGGFIRVCAQHSAVLPAENRAPGSEEKGSQRLAEWQQEALALQAEFALRNPAEEAATKLAAIVSSSDDAIASKDLNGIVTSWNAAAERMFGYKAEEIIGKSITLIIPPELRQDEDMILGKIRRGERIEHFETVRVTKSGERIEVSLSVSPIRDTRGNVVGAAKIARDITQRKQTEAALRQAEKLAASGQLAAAIAHEINNPMQALTNLLALASYRASLDPETRRLLSLADDELKRIAHITRQMLGFYRDSSTPVPLNISAVVEDILEILAPKLRANHIDVERRYHFDEPIYAFPVEMRQLFANLLTNAAEAIKAHGRIVIHLSAARDWTLPERSGLRVVIADNGPGIDAEMKKRIFEPFFTTKHEKGTGLGLWVAKGIVSKHGGGLRVRTNTAPGRSGTVFSIFLPAASHAAAVTEAIAGETNAAA